MKDIQRILFSDLRPWLDSNNKADDFYIPLTRSLKAVETKFNPRYQLNFIRHISSKTQYYKKVIDNDLTNYCNAIFAETENVSGNLIAFKIDKTRKQFHSKIKETAEIIDNQHFSLSYFSSQNANYSEDKPYKEATYIVFYLLSAFIRCWLEIQYYFKGHIAEDDLWEVADFYTQLLQINVPENTYIKEIEKIEIIASSDLTTNKIQEKSFLSLTYKQLSRNSIKITDLFNALKRNNSIDENTSITNFKRIFSGMQIEEPVKWTGAISDLSYFIKLLNNEHKVLEKTKSIWDTVCACFVDKDGNTFLPNQLKDQKKPIRNRQRD